MLHSRYKQLCEVNLPYKNRQFYMHGFNLADPHMPEGYEDYLEPVSKLIASCGQMTGKAYMTVDEKIVKAGMSQRRPKPHVDGCFISIQGRWGHPSPPWNHYCNNVPIARMPIIIAASQSAARAWKGDFDGMPKENGDLSHIEDQLDDGEWLAANTGYLLSADCVHESMAVPQDVQRTFLRIALPVDSQLEF